jgi:hypothetical protein
MIRKTEEHDPRLSQPGMRPNRTRGDKLPHRAAHYASRYRRVSALLNMRSCA